MHTCGGIQHTAFPFVAIQASLYIRFEHTIQSNSHGRITYKNMSRGYCSFLSLVRDPTDVALSKNTVPRDRSRGGRKSDNLFIYKFSRLLVHCYWYIGQVKSSQQDWLMALRKNIRSYICTGSDPGPTNYQVKIWSSCSWTGICFWSAL